MRPTLSGGASTREGAAAIGAVPAPPHTGDLQVATQTDQDTLVLRGTTAQIHEALDLVARLDVRPER